jgi:predicted phosphate transport protein (TIGR00153 family)
MALGKKKEDAFFVMFKDFSKALVVMAEKFGNIINDYCNIERTVADLKMAETECDVKTHNILEKLNESFITPFDREDIFTLTHQLDDIADLLEDIACKFVIFDVSQLRNDAVEMGNIIVDAVKQVQVLFEALPDAKKTDEAKAAVIEINRLENIGDAVFRRALTKLFKEESDAIVVIKWRELYDNLEDTLDGCEHLADTVEGVMMKNA